MIILCCVKSSDWAATANKRTYGEELLKKDGFIHCSEIDSLRLISSKFKEVSKPISILCIDTLAVTSEIKWELNEKMNRKFPHIYGLLNKDAVVKVLPYLKDENGDWIMNKELLKLSGEML